jgi:hypothetical protein
MWQMKLIAHYMRIIYDIKDERVILHRVLGPILAWVAWVPLKEELKQKERYIMLVNIHHKIDKKGTLGKLLAHKAMEVSQQLLAYRVKEAELKREDTKALVEGIRKVPRMLRI